jgi:hypothetical protein
VLASLNTVDVSDSTAFCDRDEDYGRSAAVRVHERQDVSTALEKAIIPGISERFLKLVFCFIYFQFDDRSSLTHVCDARKPENVANRCCQDREPEFVSSEEVELVREAREGILEQSKLRIRNKRPMKIWKYTTKEASAIPNQRHLEFAILAFFLWTL